MTKEEIKEKLKIINDYTTNFMFINFCVEEVHELFVKISGSTDFSYDKNSIEIVFESACYTKLLLYTWRKPENELFIELIDDLDNNNIKKELQDYYTFKLHANNDLDSLIYAKSINIIFPKHASEHE